MLKKILVGIIGLIVVLAALGFALPDKTHIERQTVINASPETVFALVSDFNQWSKWSPWDDYDPDMINTVTGSGVGQKMSWQSKKTGNGSQAITALDPPSRMTTHLEFDGMGVADAVIALEPVAEGTRVTWSFDSNARAGVALWMQPLATYMGLFMDQMLGPDYEKGLASLKKEAEAS